MEKLELKHYLDAFKYKIPFVLTDLGIFNLDLEYPDERYRDVGVITDMTTYNNGKEISGVLSLNNGCSFDFDFKLDEEPEIIQAVMPLSDLTKEIEVNGEKFVPLDAINLHECKFLHTTHLVNKMGYDFDITKIPNNSFVKLLEWHFDVFGLIEKGLAVDINTLNN